MLTSDLNTKGKLFLGDGLPENHPHVQETLEKNMSALKP